MSFEFLIAYRHTGDDRIQEVVTDVLAEVMEPDVDGSDRETVRSLIRWRHARAGDATESEDGAISRHMVLAFALELPADDVATERVVGEFTSALCETPPVYHVVKFEDPVLRLELAQRAEEIFALEMKLRRVLTFIYLHAYQNGDPYNLLEDESVQPMAKDKPEREQMRAAVENQFFHLTFAQYIGLNKRPPLQVGHLLSMVRDSASYDAFRDEVSRTPVAYEEDASLLAGLRERMQAVETMRNCVAHNRRPTRGVVQNYDNVRPLLDSMLDAYLGRWEIADDEAGHR